MQADDVGDVIDCLYDLRSGVYARDWNRVDVLVLDKAILALREFLGVRVGEETAGNVRTLNKVVEMAVAQRA